MTNYVQKNLRRNEQLIAQAEISYFALAPTIIVALLLLISGLSAGAAGFVFALIIDAIIILIGYFGIKNIELAVTNKKLIGKTGMFLGIFFSHSVDTWLEKLDNISITESFFGNIFGYATIEIHTNSAKFRFTHVKDAIAFKHTIMDQVESKEYSKMQSQANINQIYSQNAGGLTDSNRIKAAATVSTSAYPRQEIYCKKCGSQIADGMKFCNKCGERI